MGGSEREGVHRHAFLQQGAGLQGHRRNRVHDSRLACAAGLGPEVLEQAAEVASSCCSADAGLVDCRTSSRGSCYCCCESFVFGPQLEEHSFAYCIMRRFAHECLSVAALRIGGPLVQNSHPETASFAATICLLNLYVSSEGV